MIMTGKRHSFFVQYEVGYDENGVSLSQLPGRLPPPNHEFGPVKLTIFK